MGAVPLDGAGAAAMYVGGGGGGGTGDAAGAFAVIRKVSNLERLPALRLSRQVVVPVRL